MAVADINNAAGTVQVKLGPGAVRRVTGISAGTAYTFQIKDGPDQAGNSVFLMGVQAAIPVVAGTNYFGASDPGQSGMTFRNGLQVIVTGTPGELHIQYD